jgi:lipopolysaccharide/colanic/teichoic acid biosynthesis glycosyltransferase
MMSKSTAAVMPRRLFDLGVASALLVFTAPVLVMIAAALRIQNRGPVLYRQRRLGFRHQTLTLHKFRTLETDTPEDIVTPEGDHHITPVGRVLRRSRLDELPQLFDVLTGRLALVGPRPELAIDLADLDPATLEQFLAIRPGMTGPVQLEFIAEDEVLAGVADPTKIYRSQLIPAKVASNLQAFRNRTVRQDAACLMRTLFVLCSTDAREASRRRLAALSPELRAAAGP